MITDRKIHNAIARYRDCYPRCRRWEHAPRKYRIFLSAALDAETMELLVLFEVEGTGERFLSRESDWGTRTFPSPKDIEVEHWSHRPPQGSRWQPFDDKEPCTVVANAHHAHNGKHYIIKKGADGVAWALPAAQWFQPADVDGRCVLRFAPLVKSC